MKLFLYTSVFGIGISNLNVDIVRVVVNLTAIGCSGFPSIFFERLDTSCIYVLLDCNYVIFFFGVVGIYANDIKAPVLEDFHLDFG